MFIYLHYQIKTHFILFMSLIYKTVSVHSISEIDDLKVTAQITLVTDHETPEKVAEIEQLKKEIEEFIMKKLNVI